MRLWLLGMCVILLACRKTAAQPSVAWEGVLNAASYMLPAVPNSGVAQGSLFVVFGQNLGPRRIVFAPSLPLPTQLSETSVQVTVGGTTVKAYLVYTLATQVTAILPSTTPVGQGLLTVTYGGQTSSGVSVRVVKSALGIFTRNQAGSGPAIVQNYISPAELPMNAFNEAARPGQVEVLWGTGLGPISGDDSTYPPVGNLPTRVEVLVGNKTAKVAYAGRSSTYPGVDQINFEVPSGVEGCRVPLAVKVDGALSNYTTMAISSAGKMCSDPVGFSAADMQRIADKGEARLAVINLGRVSAKVGAAPGSTPVRTDQGSGQFFRRSLLEILASIGTVEVSSALGVCTVQTMRVQDLMQWLPNDPVNREPLDAGPALNLTGPQGLRQIALAGKGRYGSTLAGAAEPEYLAPGQYSVDNGGGGSDVGAFRATVTIPKPFTWTNQDSTTNVPRYRDLTVTWSGANPTGEYILIVGASLDVIRGVVGSFVCTEKASAGTFAVPAAVLSTLPIASPWTSDGDPTGMLAVSSQPVAESVKFTAPGLDIGYFQYTIEYIKNVAYQ